jgi:hypothetical protein
MNVYALLVLAAILLQNALSVAADLLNLRALSLRVFEVVIPGEQDQRLDRLGRRQVGQFQLGLRRPQRGVTALQHGDVKLVLLAEIMIEHAFVDICPLGNFVDAGSGEAFFDELIRRGIQNCAPRAIRIPLACYSHRTSTCWLAAVDIHLRRARVATHKTHVSPLRNCRGRPLTQWTRICSVRRKSGSIPSTHCLRARSARGSLYCEFSFCGPGAGATLDWRLDPATPNIRGLAKPAWRVHTEP